MIRPIAILGSMDQEIRAIEARLATPTEHVGQGRRYVSGTLLGVPAVTAITGYGKVAAAGTVACVIHRFDPRAVIFGGVAGGIAPSVDIGDIVVADRLVQHDYDASPIFDRFVIPSLGVAEIPTDPDLVERLVRAATRYVETRSQQEIRDIPQDLFDIRNLSVHTGLIASGDRFIDNVAEARTLSGDLPGLLAVEMEGAAVAQICAEFDVPVAVFRSISDRADHLADVNFLAFVTSVAAPITAGVVEELVADLN